MLLSKIEIKNAIRFSHFHDNMPQLRKTLFLNSKRKITNGFERKIYLNKNSNNFICISNDTFVYANKVLPKNLKGKIHLIENAIKYEKFHSSSNKSLN